MPDVVRFGKARCGSGSAFEAVLRGGEGKWPVGDTQARVLRRYAERLKVVETAKAEAEQALASMRAERDGIQVRFELSGFLGQRVEAGDEGLLFGEWRECNLLGKKPIFLDANPIGRSLARGFAKRNERG